MLSRRQLRIKALQALYAYFQSKDNRIEHGEKQLFKSIDKLYELCFWQLSILLEIRDFAEIRLEEAKKKHFPTPQDLNPSTKFIDNKFLDKLSRNKHFKKKSEQLKISWHEEQEMIRRLYVRIKESKVYQEYMHTPLSATFQEDQEFVIKIFKTEIAKFESLENFYEDQSIYWADDYSSANSLLMKMLNLVKEESDEFLLFPPIIKDDDDNADRDFVKNLFRKTILHSEDYQKLINEKAINWEYDRIAIMDVIILKMALAELFEFRSIPVKVTLNEYIDLAKCFSTQKSSLFVNGILDKLVIELSKTKQIVKTGRGLMT